MIMYSHSRYLLYFELSTCLRSVLATFFRTHPKRLLEKNEQELCFLRKKISNP